ncbi:MAG: ABC transporter ATP-binding protein [Bacteroides sp.]|nr:ABC transporter ATP-binding protein [Bacteroides sp.]MCM1549538.1 ABC transporter ATP-binding protein [Clostridium sp.]
MSVLQLENITKTYRDGSGKKTVLNDVSLSVEKSEFVAVVGPSGSGKSTLLTIAGMLLAPDSGKISIAGMNVSDTSKKHWTKIRQEHIGFIFQNHQLLPFLKAKEQLSAFRRNDTAVNIDELFHELDITKCEEQYPSEMSGGEKQRVAIARAFMNDPDVILADEPTASLDAARGRQVVEMIRMEVKKHDKGAVMVTHDERVLDLVDHVYRLDNGKLALQ